MASVPFNNLITFSRGSNATLTGPTGLIQYAPNNLLTNSESFNASAWSKSDATATANATTAPDGTSTADKLDETATTAQHYLFQSAGSAATHTASIYAKAAERSWLIVTVNSSNTFFNLSNGTVGSVPGGFTAVVTDAGNGWYRCSVTATLPASGPIVFSTSTANNVTSYAGTAGSGIFLWGAQLELGSAATTYNSTTVKNLLGFSEAFDNAAWTKSNASIVTGAQANPVNGAFNAQKLMENTAAGTHYALQAVSVLAAPYALSVYAKAGERSFASLAFDGLNAWFNLSTGALGTVEAGLTASIVSVGSGWYRCSVFRTVAVAGSKSCVVYPASANGTVSYTGDGNSGIYIYGAQLSDSASLDPYVPTPAAAPSSTAYYGPRFDYDPVTLQPKGLLVEEARTNITFQSGITAANWTALGGTLANTGKTSPDGTSQMGLFTEDTASSSHMIFVATQPAVIVSGTTYTASIYLAAGTRRYVVVNAGSSGSGWGVTVDTTNWTFTGYSVGGGLFQSATITPVGNGIYRVTVTGNQFAGGGISAYVVVGGSLVSTATRVDTAYLGAGGTFYVWGAQFEAGAFATSYIPTVASTVTRSADVATISGSLFSQWYGQSAGTFVSDFDALVSANVSNANVLSAYASATNLNRIWMWSGAPGIARNSVVSGGTGVSDLAGATLVANTPLKAAAAYQVDSYGFSTNGGAVASDTSGALPSGISLLGIGQTGASSEYLNGHIRSVNFIPARAADFQLQALTS